MFWITEVVAYPYHTSNKLTCQLLLIQVERNGYGSTSNTAHLILLVTAEVWRIQSGLEDGLGILPINKCLVSIGEKCYRNV